LEVTSSVKFSVHPRAGLFANADAGDIAIIAAQTNVDTMSRLNIGAPF
jgi:hypothetical protein